MTKNEAMIYACESMDKIMNLVNNLNIGTDNFGHYHLLGKTSKNDVYEAIYKIQNMVNTINEVSLSEIIESR